MSDATTVLPTATRVFPTQDTLTITMARGDGPGEHPAQLVARDGAVLWKGVGRASDRQPDLIRFVVPLAGVPPGPCQFVLTAGRPTDPRMTLGVLGGGGMP